MKSNRVLSSILAMTLILSLFFGCSSKTDKNMLTEESTKPIIAVSIVPQETFVKAVCGDLFQVISLIPPGNSPANYEPTPIEIENFSKADIYFSIGVPTEKANILKNVSENTKIVSLADLVAKKYNDLQIDGSRDPHIWLSPKRVSVMIDSIADELSLIDSDNEDLFKSNAEKFKASLEEVDKKIKDELLYCENKNFLAFHPAFGYFANDYGMKMITLQKNGKEATPADLVKMIDYAKKEKIKFIFCQAEIDSNQTKAFAEEIGAKVIFLEPLSADYLNNMNTMAKSIKEALED